jgi:hypothetical protein
MANSTNNLPLSVICYNLHGFNQGMPMVFDMASSNCAPDIFLLQEHWLTPANMNKFDTILPSYYASGQSGQTGQQRA